MKFLRITFRCFGPFEKQTLEFAKGNGLHIVFGPNEAGKSCALRGLHALLFGFPVRSNDNFRFQYNQFRVEALLENSAGEQLECVRRKGNRATLRDREDKIEIAETRLTQFLGGLQEQQFEQLFGLDSQRLIAGGRDIAEGKGDLGGAMFAAGAGMAGLRALTQAIEQRRNQLYRPQAQQPPINSGLTEFKRQCDAVRENMLPPDTYADAVVEVNRTQQAVSALRQERAQVRQRRELLKDFQAALPMIELLQRARERLQPVADAPLLEAGFESKVADARANREVAQSRLHDLEADQGELEQKMCEEAPPAAVLAEEEEIDEVMKLVGADAKAQAEAIKADTRRREEEGKARDIFRELTGTTAWEQMAGLKPRLEDERKITDLANEFAAVSQAVASAQEVVRLAREALALAEQRQATLSVPAAPAIGVAAVEAIADHGPVEQQLRELEREVAATQRRLTVDFARCQPAAPGTWTGAAGVPVPSAETIREFKPLFAEAERAVRHAAEQGEQIDRDLFAIRGQVAENAGAESLPTAADLSTARRERDGGLHLIRLRLAQEPRVSLEEEFTKRHAPGQELIDATDATVRQADAVADRLRHEADRVANWQSLQQQLELLHDRRRQLAEKQAEDQQSLSDIHQRWQAVWQSAGISPEGPDAMQAWLARWERFTEQVVAWSDLQLSIQAQEHLIERLKARLAEACPSVQSMKTLAEGLALARQAIKDAGNQQAAVAELNREILRRNSELAAAQESLQQGQSRQLQWQQQWTSAIAVLALQGPSVSINTAQDYLRRISEMQQHLTDMRIKAARVNEIHQERAALLERLNALRRRLDPLARLSTADTLEADCRYVESTLFEARERRTRQAERSKQLARIKSEIIVQRDVLRGASATLAALAKEARATDVEAIETAVQRAKQRAEADCSVREQETALAQVARGQPLEEFMVDALAQRDPLHNELDSLGRRAEQLDPEISAAEAAALKATQVLEGYQQASDKAAAAQQQGALIVSRLEEHVVDYAALHLALAVLERAKERYRARHQDTMLSRAGEFFQILTDQAFHGIDIDNEEGKDVLKSVRANGQANDGVPVDGLSDGTRDQLFLAFRLAGIEQHLRDREPVPLIIDDVLMSFDDRRSRSTLKCLAELALKTQVLLFTHHRHVVELATAIHAKTEVHELAPSRQ